MKQRFSFLFLFLLKTHRLPPPKMSSNPVQTANLNQQGNKSDAFSALNINSFVSHLSDTQKQIQEEEKRKREEQVSNLKKNTHTHTHTQHDTHTHTHNTHRQEKNKQKRRDAKRNGN